MQTKKEKKKQNGFIVLKMDKGYIHISTWRTQKDCKTFDAFVSSLKHICIFKWKIEAWFLRSKPFYTMNKEQ